MAFREDKGTPVISHLIPLGKYPSHFAIYGRGGYKTVDNELKRYEIPIDRLTVGSVVYQHDTREEWVVTKLPDNINSDYHTGKDCEWELKKGSSIDEEQLNNLVRLDEERKVPISLSRGLVFRGNYIESENQFTTLIGDKEFQTLSNAIYIDNNTNKIYTWDGNKFVRDSGDKLYWVNVN